jgi:hypothetical protein
MVHDALIVIVTEKLEVVVVAFAVPVKQRATKLAIAIAARKLGRDVAWGNTLSNWESGTGSGLGQSLTVYGLVPAQTTPAPGIYTDTIVATVTY